MRLFAIGDLHMSGGDDKPMDIFGTQWDRHFLRISENWRKVVSPDDTVLIPGDISWAMQLENALPDLQEIGKLPGKKILCKGNHEYWWNSISRIRAVLPDGMQALQFDAADLGCCVVCGTRGWLFPTDKTPLAAQDEKICIREAQRLALALDAADRIGNGRPIVVMMHYPPLLKSDPESVFTDILQSNPRVRTVVYGHLHGAAFANAFDGEKGIIRYYPVSCDGIGFCPREIPVPNS